VILRDLDASEQREMPLGEVAAAIGPESADAG